MVKRKADISLDEWLASGHETSGSNSVATAAVVIEAVQAEGLTVTVVVDQPMTEPVPVPTENVASYDEGDSTWFWALLELSGYERW